HADQPPVDRAPAGDHAVARDPLLLHPEVGAAMGDELVDLGERAGVEEHVDPLARRELSGLVLLVDPGFSAARFGFLVAALQLLELLIVGGRRHAGLVAQLTPTDDRTVAAPAKSGQTPTVRIVVESEG